MILTEIMFYHLMHSPLEAALPILLEKSLAKGWNVIIRSEDENHIEKLNHSLWNYSEDSFLPHDSHQGEKAQEQPIYLTIHDENPNKAAACFLIDGAMPFAIDEFERIIYMFDGRNEDRLTAARSLWKQLKTQDYSLTYWQQDFQGRWSQQG